MKEIVRSIQPPTAYIFSIPNEIVLMIILRLNKKERFIFSITCLSFYNSFYLQAIEDLKQFSALIIRDVNQNYDNDIFKYLSNSSENFLPPLIKSSNDKLVKITDVPRNSFRNLFFETFDGKRPDFFRQYVKQNNKYSLRIKGSIYTQEYLEPYEYQRIEWLIIENFTVDMSQALYSNVLDLLNQDKVCAIEFSGFDHHCKGFTNLVKAINKTKNLLSISLNVALTQCAFETTVGNSLDILFKLQILENLKILKLNFVEKFGFTSTAIVSEQHINSLISLISNPNSNLKELTIGLGLNIPETSLLKLLTCIENSNTLSVLKLNIGGLTTNPNNRPWSINAEVIDHFFHESICSFIKNTKLKELILDVCYNNNSLQCKEIVEVPKKNTNLQHFQYNSYSHSFNYNQSNSRHL